MNMVIFVTVTIFQLLICTEAAPGTDQLGVELVSDTTNVCVTSACNASALKVSENIDPTTNPCDNFYQFACGGYVKKNEIPNGKGSISQFTTLHDEIQKQLKHDLESTIGDEDSRPWKMTKQFYNLCMNIDSINKDSEKEFLDVLKKVGGWPIIEGPSWNESTFRWENLMYQLHEMGEGPNYFFDLEIARDPSNHSERILQVSAPKPGLDSKYLYRRADQGMIFLYFFYIHNLATMLGADGTFAWTEVKNIVDFEIDLVENLSPPNSTDDGKKHSITVKELGVKYPNIPWTEYLNEFLKPHATIQTDERILIENQQYFEGFSKLLETTPKRVVADYAIWRFVQGSAIFLSERIRIVASEFSRRTTGTSSKPREEECLSYTSIIFNAALSSYYVKKNFDATSKNMALKMVTNIRTSLQEILEEVDWMDSSTRANALTKFDWMLAFVGYPDELLNDEIIDKFYENLSVDTGSFFKSLLNYGRFSQSKIFEDLRKPIERTDWVPNSQTVVVNAYYRMTDNTIIIPAGILQGEFFSQERPNYLNYGSIGWVLGHEITHGFDNQGSKYDKIGEIVDWWDPKTKEKFVERTKCMIEQYSNYTSEEVHMNLNGTSTLGENIADNGGIKEAYRAYYKREESDGVEPALPGLPYTPKQLFWISAANTYCEKTRDLNLIYQIWTDEHAPGEFRVIGTLSNMPEFAQDFSCPTGSRMNPVEKCTVW